MEQFTASEVRDWERAYKGTGAAKVFGAFADMLEAQEKAVPVMVVNHVSSAEHDLPIGMKLYAHPSPSDAERLAEALERTARHRAAADRIDPDQWRSVLYSWEDRALAAHSAQAQPPAASVADGFASWGDWLESLTDDELVTIFYHYTDAANRMKRLLAATPQPAKESDR